MSLKGAKKYVGAADDKFKKKSKMWRKKELSLPDPCCLLLISIFSTTTAAPSITTP